MQRLLLRRCSHIHRSHDRNPECSPYLPKRSSPHYYEVNSIPRRFLFLSYIVVCTLLCVAAPIYLNVTLTCFSSIPSSLMLAAKFFDDYFYNNAFYAKLGGVASIEMNSLELEFLQLLNFSLFVSPEVYLKYHAELRNYVGVVNIPVYLSSSFPNSPTTDKITKGNSFLSRPPSTSPFLPLVEMARFPTPPLLDVAFDQNQKVQSYYQHLLEHNSSVPQVSQYESLSPMSQRTFINSSLSPCEEPVPVPFGYSPSSSFGADQIPLGRNQYGQYCVVPMPQGSQYYPHGNQGKYYTPRLFSFSLSQPIFMHLPSTFH